MLFPVKSCLFASAHPIWERYHSMLPSFFSALSPAASSWLEASPLACSQLSESNYFSNSDTGCPTLMKTKPESCVKK